MIGRGRGGPFPSSQRPQIPVLKKIDDLDLNKDIVE
jgi:hypothetical protein